MKDGDLGDLSIEELANLEGDLESGDKPKKAKPKKTTTRKRPLEKRLEEFFGMIGLGVSVVDEFDGKTILSKSSDLAKSLDKLASENASVKRILEALLTGSAWAEVVGVLGTVLVPIAVHHRMLPDEINDRVATMMSVPLVEPKPKKDEEKRPEIVRRADGSKPGDETDGD